MNNTRGPLRDDELRIEREFDAPVELVFELWESAEHVMRWWGPEEFTTTWMEWDPHPGRRWRATMAARGYGVFGMGGTFREVERNRRLVFTFAWDEDSGRDQDTLVTVTFEARGGRTLQTFHQTPFSTAAIRDSHTGGWSSLFRKQALYVENFHLARMKGMAS